MSLPFGLPALGGFFNVEAEVSCFSPFLAVFWVDSHQQLCSLAGNLCGREAGVRGREGEHPAGTALRRPAGLSFLRRPWFLCGRLRGGRLPDSRVRPGGSVLHQCTSSAGRLCPETLTHSLSPV